MASTIITKHGSASNAPSSLTQGELAINVTNGKLYYGSGSQTATSVAEDFTFGHITSSGIWVSGSSREFIHLNGDLGSVSASGNISSGGHITSSGRIQTLSHITASGNISASGTMRCSSMKISTAYRIEDSGGTSRHVLRGASIGNEIELGNTNFTDGIRITGNITSSGTIRNSGSIVHGNVSASGNISATGDITSSATIIGATLVATGNVSASGNIVTSGFISSSGRLQTLSHITASGNISASGHISCSGLIVPERSGLVNQYRMIGYATGDGTNFEFAKNMATNTAPFNHDISFGSDGLTAQTVQTVIRMGGIIINRASTLKRWTGWSTCQGSGTANIALFKVTPTRNDNTNLSAVLLHDYSYTALGNAKMEDFDLTEFTVSSLAAGDMIMSGMKSVAGQVHYFTSMFEVEFD